jgi:Sec-independent protein translocase protein TatA
MFSPLHWFTVGVVALLVLGPDRLPQAVREAAKLLRRASAVRESITNEIRNALDDDGEKTERET